MYENFKESSCNLEQEIQISTLVPYLRGIAYVRDKNELKTDLSTDSFATCLIFVSFAFLSLADNEFMWSEKKKFHFKWNVILVEYDN